MDFEKHYSPKEFEKQLYESWEAAGNFQPKPGTTGKTYYIPIPPPNVTGILHIGHALTMTLEDIMTRYHRMKGDETLWVPGTDHAGISTQVQVEKKLAKEGKTKHDLGREKFIEAAWDWTRIHGGIIQSQIRALGASCDWSKERFTLDAGLNKIVEHAFVDLYNKKLLYRGEYMINFSSGLQTAIADDEVEYREEEAKMYYVTYFVSGSDNELIVATTRPETLLADMAVAVHPKDKRYKKMIGRSVILPIVNKEIPIIGDEMVDMDFGTGVVKITPAHDPTDFDTGKRHNLRLDYQVIDRSGVMTKEAGIFAGQDVKTARENVVELLRAKGNLIKIEPHTQRVAYCERSGTRVESVVSTQWFVRMPEMAKKVIAGYKKGEFKILPEKFNKVFEDWIYNLRDWCVSRQLWWGHQIPAYFHKETGDLLGVTLDPKDLFAKYGEENVRRDEDVLDTWFSSALWPFSILDWDATDPGELFKKFYPAQMLETGHDIIFFWVTRMLLMGYEYTGQTPFKTIYLHGLIFDEHGKKMSKSLGNGVDPIKIIEEYSADSLRLSTTLGNTPGNNLNFSMKFVENNTLFLNKLWNIVRFVHTTIGEITEDEATLVKTIADNYDSLMDHEKWIISRLKNITDVMTEGMEKYSFSETGLELAAFTRDEFADFYLEEHKYAKDESKYGREVLSLAISTLLKLWHPYIPFVTEELYAKMIPGKSLMMEPWPVIDLKRDTKIEKEIGILYDVVRTIRNIRAEKNIKPGEQMNICFVANKSNQAFLESNKTILLGLARLAGFEFVKLADIEQTKYAYGVVKDVEIFVELPLGVDNTEERARIKEQIDDKKEYIRIIDIKLTNSDFVRNAPTHVVQKEQEKRAQAAEQLQKLEQKFSLLV